MVISVHVPKTAGRSFLAYLRGCFGDAVIEDWKGGPRLEGGASVLAALRQAVRDQEDRLVNYRRRRSVRCIHGHFQAGKYAFLGGPLVAWVRDPVERVVSHYSYQRRHPDAANRHSTAIAAGLSLIDFAALPRMRDLQTRYLNLPLDRMSFVGRTEHFAEDLARMARVLGLTVDRSFRLNVNPERTVDRYPLSDADRTRVAQLNRGDALLYRRVVETFHG